MYRVNASTRRAVIDCHRAVDVSVPREGFVRRYQLNEISLKLKFRSIFQHDDVTLISNPIWDSTSAFLPRFERQSRRALGIRAFDLYYVVPRSRNTTRLDGKSTRPFRGIESQPSKRAILDCAFCETWHFITYARSIVRSNMRELYVLAKLH